jgi:uncharacterized membrane protein HdeD (DUF308 family)
MSEPIMGMGGRPAAGLFVEGLHELRRNWGWFLVLGILLIVGGILAVGYAFVATVISVVFIGWLLFFDGVVHAIMAFWARRWGGFLRNLLGGVLAIVLGLLLVSRPLAGAAVLTLLIAAFFLVGGVFQLVAAIMMQFPSWPWAMLTGAIDLLLGILIWSEWPSTAEWVIGTFVGIGMIFRGWAYVMFALAVRRHIPHASAPPV